MLSLNSLAVRRLVLIKLRRDFGVGPAAFPPSDVRWIVSLGQRHDKILAPKFPFERLGGRRYTLHKSRTHNDGVLNRLARWNSHAIGQIGTLDDRSVCDVDFIPKNRVAHFSALGNRGT